VAAALPSVAHHGISETVGVLASDSTFSPDEFCSEAEEGSSGSSVQKDSSGASLKEQPDVNRISSSLNVEGTGDGSQEAKPPEDNADAKEEIQNFKVFDRQRNRWGYTDLTAKLWLSDFENDHELNSRIKHADKRWLQSTLFHSLVNDRLSDLEKNMRKLLQQPEQVAEKLNSSNVAQYESEIAKLNWSQFASQYELSERRLEWEHVQDVDIGEKKVIEILTEEPRYGISGWMRSSQRAPRRVNPAFHASKQATAARDHLQDIDSLVPYRIRIRSPILLKVLSQITGIEIAIGPHKHQVVFIRPFKVLTKNYKNILEELARFESSHAGPNSSKLCACPQIPS
jgi:hypothetical protein